MLYALGPSPLVLYAFSFRDPLTGRWIKARHREEHYVIAMHYRETEWRIEGTAEIRSDVGGSFNPWLGPSTIGPSTAEGVWKHHRSPAGSGDRCFPFPHSRGDAVVIAEGETGPQAASSRIALIVFAMPSRLITRLRL